MSLLAGFDCVIELSEAFLAVSISSSLQQMLGNPIVLPRFPDGQGGTFTIALNSESVQVQLLQDPQFSVTIDCDYVTDVIDRKSVV